MTWRETILLTEITLLDSGFIVLAVGTVWRMSQPRNVIPSGVAISYGLVALMIGSTLA